MGLKGLRCFTPKCALERRKRQMGSRGRRRRRVSERGLQLIEKQKAKFTYGMMERQFHNLFEMAARQQGHSGDNLTVLLERRLDNVVYRLGFAESRPQARQLVLHGHIMLNGKKTNISSALVHEGDNISWREGSKNTEYAKTLREEIKSRLIPNWLTLDREKLEGQIVSMPAPEEVGVQYNGASIVEFYSR